MKIQIHDIGKIAEANIELNGLTVLGGLNDIGKSTIGKVIFAVIKANSEEEFVDDRQEQISNIFNRLAIDIRKITGIRISPYILPSRIKELRELNEETVERLFDPFYNKIPIDLIESDNLEIKNILDLAKKKLHDVFSQEINKSEKYRKSFNRITASLFKGEFHNKKSLESSSKILFSDDVNSIKVTNSEFELSGNLLFDNVTLIESPIILSLHYIVMAMPFKVSRSVLGHYNIDLLQKISYATRDNYEGLSDLQKTTIEQINNTLNGKMYFDKEKGDFLFEQNDSLSFKSVNIASGIKSFGIIQLLIIAGVIAPNTVLIIDEPEVHLHPEWQLKYAKLITYLVDMGVFVVVSSHSPYMIEALKTYSDKAGQEKITNFYVGESTEKGTVFKDVTQNLEPLFELLAIPMQKLTFED